MNKIRLITAGVLFMSELVSAYDSCANIDLVSYKNPLSVSNQLIVPLVPNPTEYYMIHLRAVKELFEAHKELNRKAKIIDEALGGAEALDAKGFEQLMDQIILGFLGIPEIARALKQETRDPKNLPSLRSNIEILNGLLSNAITKIRERESQKIIRAAIKNARRMQTALPDAEMTINIREIK